MDDRITRDLLGWDGIADHRTGSRGDAATAAWLADAIRSAGARPDVVDLAFSRRVPGDCFVAAEGWRAPGVPLFDGGATDHSGVSGRLGELGSDAPLGLAFYEPFGGDADSRALQAAREAGHHRAIVAVAAGKTVRPGLALMNAEHFDRPFGPPVLQIATEHGERLRGLAARGATIAFAAPMDSEPVAVSNVQTRIRGSRPELAPLVIMTPRSAWWTCTSERGGGITVWLEAIRRWARTPAPRSLLFTANTGHELGHVGLARFLDSKPELVRTAHAWVHLGANFAAAGGRVRYQASDAELMRLGLDAIADAGVERPELTEIGQRPYGEARNVFDGGGRYVSLLGTNPLFHQPDDRWPDAVDLTRTRRLSGAMLSVMNDLVRG